MSTESHPSSIPFSKEELEQFELIEDRLSRRERKKFKRLCARIILYDNYLSIHATADDWVNYHTFVRHLIDKYNPNLNQ